MEFVTLILGLALGAAVGISALYFYQNSRGTSRIQEAEEAARRKVDEAEKRAR